METKKRKITDPEEYAIIKSVYFDKDNGRENIEQSERWERIDARNRNTNNNAR